MQAPGITLNMGIRTALAAAAFAALVVNANGFERVVASSAQGTSCDVSQATNGTTVTCPDGSRGSMVLYRSNDEGAACQLDFWFGPNGSGAQTWHALLSHQNSGSGACALNWTGPNTLNVTL